MTEAIKNFDALIVEALAEWPQQISFGRIDIDYSPAREERPGFYVEGLGDIPDEIDEPHIGTEQEVIWRTLHHAIHIVVHAAARYIMHLDMSNLRLLEVKYYFEENLRYGLQDPAGLYWRESDIQLVYEYFEKEGRPLPHRGRQDAP